MRSRNAESSSPADVLQDIRDIRLQTESWRIEIDEIKFTVFGKTIESCKITYASVTFVFS